MSDFYFYLKDIEFNENSLNKRLKLLYGDILNYNKNVFPLYEYEINNPKNIYDMINGLEYRRNIIKNIKTLPSIAIRNLKNDIRKERDIREISSYSHNIDYFIAHYTLLSNRDKEQIKTILNKMFKSNITLDGLIDFVEDKENLIGGVEFTRDKIIELSKTVDIEIIYEKNHIMIIRVDSPDGIKSIGCNSLWCFTYGSGFEAAYRQWNNYSYNDMVYVLIDFREKSDSSEFMFVLIKPLFDENGKLNFYDDDNEDEYPIYNMLNENYYNPYGILKHLFGVNFKKIIFKYLNFGML